MAGRAIPRFGQENRALWGWLGALALTALLTPAGGLGLAGTAALLALVALPVRTLAEETRKPASAWTPAALALGWVMLTHMWSPYRNPDEMLKLALLTPLFMLVPVIAASIRDESRRLALAAYVAMVLTVLLVLLAEALTSGDITLSYKLGVEDYTLDRTDLQIRVNKTLSRAATPAIMFGGVAVILLWVQRHPALRLLAVLAGMVTVLIAFDFGVQANAVALLAGCIVTAFAWKWPGLTLRALLAGLAISLITGPLLFGAMMSLAGPETRANLPMSWEWRIEIWEYALQQIRQAPLAGHGIGASRVLGATTELRGYEIDLLPLHAHSAALTVWLETGLVGAGLIAAALAVPVVKLGSATITPRFSMMVCFVIVVWSVNVQFSYGIWQEWHHGALALAIAAAMIARPRTRP